MWQHTFGEASVPVDKLGRVQAPRGVNLRMQPAPDASSVSSPVPFNGLVHVARRTTQRSVAERWCYVIAADGGAAGFCEERYLAIDPPEPTATLRRTAAGERLAAIAEEVYGPATREDNSRLRVHALYLANRARPSIRLDHVDLSLGDRALRGDAEERTLEIYRGAKVIAGDSIWIPSKQFLEQLKAAGAVTGGSTVGAGAWNTAKAAVGTVVEGAKFLGGLVVGVLEGAFNAIVDLFKGALDMIKLVAEVVWDLVTGNLGHIKAMATSWIDKMQTAWEHRGDIVDEFVRKWNAEDMWDRGRFQGEVCGWLAMTVLIIILTAGEGAPAALGSIALRWPQLIKLIKTVDALGDVTTYVGAAVKATKLPGRAADLLTGKLGKSADRAAEDGVDDIANATTRGRGTVEGPDNSASNANTSGTSRQTVTVTGYAQHPKLYPWRKNFNGAVRSIDDAIEIARVHGVVIPDDILLRKVKGKMLPDNTYAEYFSRKGRDPKQMIRWEEFYDKDLDELVVRVSDGVFESDEAIVAILSHEMHELNELRRIFKESGGAISMQKLYNLINPGISKNLHDEAWDVADRLVLTMRKKDTQ